MEYKNKNPREQKKDPEFISEMKKKIFSRRELALAPENEARLESCGTYLREDFERYWDGVLNSEQKKQMESHCFTCLPCLEAFEKIHAESEQEKLLERAFVDSARNFIRTIKEPSK